MMNNMLFTLPEGQYVFRQTDLDSKWRCISYVPWITMTLADILNLFDVTIDDDAQFCRIIRWCGRVKTTFTYRHYNDAKITICLTRSSI